MEIARKERKPSALSRTYLKCWLRDHVWLLPPLTYGGSRLSNPKTLNEQKWVCFYVFWNIDRKYISFYNFVIERLCIFLSFSNFTVFLFSNKFLFEVFFNNDHSIFLNNIIALYTFGIWCRCVFIKFNLLHCRLLWCRKSGFIFIFHYKKNILIDFQSQSKPPCLRWTSWQRAASQDRNTKGSFSGLFLYIDESQYHKSGAITLFKNDGF